MKKNTRMIIVLISTMILSACAPPLSSRPAIGSQAASSIPAISFTQAYIPTSPTPQNINILYSDDFSVESIELETFTEESGSAETKDGAYIMRTISDVWNWGRSNSEFSDTVIDFDVTITSAPVNNNAGAGMICRMHSREDDSLDGYMLAISGDGFYSIHSITSGSMSPLVDWTFSDVINQGNLENRISATCNGGELILEVNGNLLATASSIASGPESGKFALAAISFEADDPVAEVRFDNLIISKP